MLEAARGADRRARLRGVPRGRLHGEDHAAPHRLDRRRRASAELLEVDVRGNAFLRNMVRILVGTLAEVGAGHATDRAKWPRSLPRETGRRPDRPRPPQGLELVEVRYDGTGPRPDV